MRGLSAALVPRAQIVLARIRGASPFHWLVLLALTVGSLAQDPGRTTFDTKFDLTTDPLAMLARALHLWDPSQTFGGVGDQAYGYFFPQGPWFVLGHALGMPEWIVQRLWSALVLVVAHEGARRLARALKIGGREAPIIVGLAYALSPRLFALAGVLSAEVLPTAVLPWVCLPLVLGVQGRISPRRAGLLAGIAFLFVGGVNAIEDLAILPLPFVIVASGLGARAGRRLGLWWVAATSAAAAWWLLPLLVLGKYSPPFLDYVETASTTTRTTGWSNSVRGAEHWLNYLLLGGKPWWQGAQDLSGQPFLVLAAAVVTGIGVVGLAHSSMPLRCPLLLSALIGLICLTVGHGGPIGSIFAGDTRTLLDGTLAALRNVHKVDPLVRLPLALGFGHACALMPRAGHRRRILQDQSWGMVTALLAIGVLITTATPMLAGTLRHPGWTSVPSAWSEAGSWLNHAPGTTLVVPSSASGQQVWGWTVDEPLQGLTNANWVTRTQLPLAPGPTIRLLNAIDQRLESGSGSPELAATLAASGVTKVLLRSDVDTVTGDVGDPARVAAALANSPGVVLERTFGPIQADGLPEIQIFKVAGSTSFPVLTAAALPVLVGDPEDVLAAREAGLLAPDQHVRVGMPSAGQAPVIVGDSYRRVERQFGRVQGSVTGVMTWAEPMRLKRKVADYPGVQGVPLVYARYDDLTDVVASSSAGYVDGFARTDPALGPAAAVDGDPATYWESAPFTEPVGQWVQLNLRQGAPIGKVTVQVVTNPLVAVPIRQVLIAAGSHRASATVNPLTGEASADFGGVPASSVRVTVNSVGPHPSGSPVGISDITVVGLDQRRTLVVPDTDANAHTSFVFTAQPPQRACLNLSIGLQCSLDSAKSAPEADILSRTFTVHQVGAWGLSGSVVALSGSAANALVAQGSADGLTATSTSVLGGDPAAGPMFAIDGDPNTAWLAQPGDRNPSVVLRWKGPRTLSRLSVNAADSVTLPSSADLVFSNGQRRRVSLGVDGLGLFTPIRADGVTITFHSGLANTTQLAMSEIRLTGLADLERPLARLKTIQSVCGTGPAVTVDGRTYRTSVSGSVGDVIAGRPLSWRVCDGSSEINLLSGAHRVDVAGTNLWAPTGAVLRSNVASPGTASSSRSIVAMPDSKYQVGPGDASILLLGANQNDGWRAMLAGKQLKPVVLDGWQQGFVIPPGVGGVVHVSFAGDRPYELLLLGGAIAALLLLVLLGFDLVRPAPPSEPGAGSRARRRGFPRMALACGGVVIAFLVGGLAFAGGALGALILQRWLPSWLLGWVAGFLVALSGALALVDGEVATGRTILAADVVAAVGMGVVAATLMPSRRRAASDD